MNAREAKRRLSAVAAAVVFLSVMAIPAVYGGVGHPESSCVSSLNQAQPETIAVEIRECLGDVIGSSYTVEMPEEALRRLKAGLHDASDLQQKFEVLQNYGLLHDDLSRERIQRQYEAYMQEQRRTSSIMDTLPTGGADGMLVNFNCDMFVMGTIMLSFPMIMSGLGFLLVSSAIPLPFTGVGAVFWLLAKIMLLVTIGQLLPALAPFVGYTPLTVPFGLFWGPGIIDTNGTAGQWSTGGWLTGVVIGHFGVWVNAFFFSLFLGHTWAVAVHV